MGDTTIRVKEQVADELHNRKGRGESYNDVILRLIEQANGLDNSGTARESRETATQPADTSRDPQPSESERRDEEASSGAGSHGPEDWVADHLKSVEFPAGRDRDECIEAITAVYSHLQANDRASKSEIVATVMPDHPLGYEIPETSTGFKGSWWRNVVKPSLEELPGVVKPTGGGEWRYTGPE